MRACAPLLVLLLAAAGCLPEGGSGASGPAPSRVEPVLADRPDTHADGSVRIASIFPTLGRYALSGTQSHNGAQMAVDAVNAQGGVGGRPLKLVAWRTGSHVVDARHAAELAAAAGVVAIVGSNSSALSRVVAAVAQAAGIPQVSNVSTAHDLTWDPATGRNREFVFRVCGSDDAMGTALARFAAEHLHARRAAILYEIGREYSAHLARSFIEHFAEEPAQRVSAEFVYLPLETDFETQLRAVAAFRPDVVFVPGSFTDATLVGMQSASMGIHATLLGGDGWSNTRLFRRGGPLGEAYYADHCAPPPSFGERYRARWGEAAEGCRAVLAYDAVTSLAVALGRMGPLDEAALGTGIARTRARLRDELAVVSFDGQAGPVRFDEHGDVQRGVAIIRWTSDEGQRLHARVEPP